MAAGSLFKRFGTAEEVAKLARFLLSDESSYIIGDQYPPGRRRPPHLNRPSAMIAIVFVLIALCLLVSTDASRPSGG